MGGLDVKAKEGVWDAILVRAVLLQNRCLNCENVIPKAVKATCKNRALRAPSPPCGSCSFARLIAKLEIESRFAQLPALAGYLDAVKRPTKSSCALRAA